MGDLEEKKIYLHETVSNVNLKDALIKLQFDNNGRPYSRNGVPTFRYSAVC